MTVEATGQNTDKQRANTKDEDPTGLLNEGFRYRDLETGVWLSRDPAGFVDGPNLYAYVLQNPWTAWDPLGLETRKELQQMRTDAVNKRNAAQKSLQEYTAEQRAKRTWKGNLNDPKAKALFNEYRHQNSLISQATNRLDRLEKSARTIAIVAKLSSEAEFDIENLDDNSEIVADGAKLADYGGYATDVAAFYGGRAIGAGISKLISGIAGRISTRNALNAAEAELGAELVSLAKVKHKPTVVIGAVDPATGRSIASRSHKGYCAERAAADALDVADETIIFTQPVRPRTGEVIPVC